MNKKRILNYILFIIGGILFCLNIINVFSALLFFCGGYLSLKNTFDYRQNRCNNRIENDIKKNKEKDICVHNKSIDISKRNVKTRVRKK